MSTPVEVLMSITTERRVSAHRGSTHRGSAVRRRPTPQRRRYLHTSAPQGMARGHREACVEDRSPQTLSWTATVLGVLATAVVLLAFVAVANLRAGSIESAPQVGVAVVQQGETLSDVAQRIAPGVPVQDVVDSMLELNGLAGASVSQGQQLVIPATAGR
ncbi:LysM peptidoglycan-binding domain-containing protein [Rhodococcus sp. BGS-1C]|uniref:LysM peptidoglycan-binding domain-containing protein n=1 Tax=unclassified Rhodococcus (in: high G+C Gram-positive bacteria) TaxID=192944 RepID=UPI0019CF6279|nr:LysM peptidoglycan-binding domain-containing protein [Rhodococcus sp. KRD197]